LLVTIHLMADPERIMTTDSPISEDEFDQRYAEFRKTSLPGEELFADTGRVLKQKSGEGIFIEQGNINVITSEALESQSPPIQAVRKPLSVRRLASFLPTILG